MRGDITAGHVLQHAHACGQPGPHTDLAVLDHDALIRWKSHDRRRVLEQAGIGLPRADLVGAEHAITKVMCQAADLQRVTNLLGRPAGSHALGRRHRIQHPGHAGHRLELAREQALDIAAVARLEIGGQCFAEPSAQVNQDICHLAAAVACREHFQRVGQLWQQVQIGLVAQAFAVDQSTVQVEDDAAVGHRVRDRSRITA